MIKNLKRVVEIINISNIIFAIIIVYSHIYLHLLNVVKVFIHYIRYVVLTLQLIFVTYVHVGKYETNERTRMAHSSATR